MILTDGQSCLIDKLITWYKNWYLGNRTGQHPQWMAYSGAAGTGKTTVIKTLLEELNLSDNDYISCAFVGKAVLQLQKNRLNARTIHSLIYDLIIDYIVDEKTGQHIEKLRFVLKNKLEHDYHLIIVDEATMVNDEMCSQLLSFGIPIIFVGDKNQLPPVFGVSSVMLNPDYTLTQIMRQAEDDPIVKLSQMVLNGIPIFTGNYGKSKVVRNVPLDDRLLSDYDQILTTTNKMRNSINEFVREELKGYHTREPRLFDKIICRQNNWDTLVDGYALTNGISGIITDISRCKLHSGYYVIDFKPDFFENNNKEFLGLHVDAKHLTSNAEDQKNSKYSKLEKFEYAYAITVHLSQGSEYDRVLYFDQFFHDAELTKKARYTAITRAKEELCIVLSTDRESNNVLYHK